MLYIKAVNGVRLDGYGIDMGNPSCIVPSQ